MSKTLFHIHTFRCGHAEEIEDEAYVRRAIELGAEGICFADHVPFEGDHLDFRMPYHWLDDYLSTMQRLKKKYADKIDLKVGMEVEYLPSYENYFRQLNALDEVDFLLLGQHFFEVRPGEYSFNTKCCQRRGAIDAMCQGIETGLFPVVAHPDRIFRVMDEWDEQCTRLSEKLIETAVRHGVYLEKNYASMCNEGYYWPEFWELVPPEAKIVYGLDAHYLQDMEAGARWLEERLEARGSNE